MKPTVCAVPRWAAPDLGIVWDARNGSQFRGLGRGTLSAHSGSMAQRWERLGASFCATALAALAVHCGSSSEAPSSAGGTSDPDASSAAPGADRGGNKHDDASVPALDASPPSSVLDPNASGVI